MLINKIDKEFRELNKMMGGHILNYLLDILREGKDIKSGDLLNWNPLIRQLSKAEALIEDRKFEVEIVKFYAANYVEVVKRIFDDYDSMASILKTNTDTNERNIPNVSKMFYKNISILTTIIEKISMSNEIISEIMSETWEPLPNDKMEDNVENIVISSETRSMSLNDVASDVGNLNNFFENICRLISSDQSLSDNVYLRRVETGSLLVAVSCSMQAAPIIAFIFWCVKLYQKAEKRYLDNADNKLKVINDSLNIAKEILKIDPENKEADEIIQKCGVSVLNFLENNPTGTINGERYDIGMEKPKIEDKENK